MSSPGSSTTDEETGGNLYSKSPREVASATSSPAAAAADDDASSQPPPEQQQTGGRNRKRLFLYGFIFILLIAALIISLTWGDGDDTAPSSQEGGDPDSFVPQPEIGDGSWVDGPGAIIVTPSPTLTPTPGLNPSMPEMTTASPITPAPITASPTTPTVSWSGGGGGFVWGAPSTKSPTTATASPVIMTPPTTNNVDSPTGGGGFIFTNLEPTTVAPSKRATLGPSKSKTNVVPTRAPVAASPQTVLTSFPTNPPTNKPTTPEPSASPTIPPSNEPTLEPSSSPSKEPTPMPTKQPTPQPSLSPTTRPTINFISITNVNVASNKLSTASSEPDTSRYAFDGNPETRWTSAVGNDDEWLEVDLGAVYQLSRVIINWEFASAKSYDIRASIDGASYETLASKNDGFAGMDYVTSYLGGGFGRYVRMQGLERATEWGYSIWEMEVFGRGPLAVGITGNIANGKLSTASSQPEIAMDAFDGDPETRWISTIGSDDEWLEVDLGSVFKLSSVSISWEFASAKSYDIQVSIDGSDYTTVWSKLDGFAGMGIVESSLEGATGRYVRMQGYEPVTEFGYSIWEMEVYGSENMASGMMSSSSSQPKLAANAFDGDPTTSWISLAGSDNEWIEVDLEAVYQLSSVSIAWDDASAKSYDIQASIDGSTYATLWSKNDGFAGMGTVESLLGGRFGRYVRMQGRKRATNLGYSISEMEVYVGGV